MPDVVLIIFLFALGACVGSFLNVVVWRLPRGESLVSPGSHCPKCNTPLKWYDNLPIVGWLKLRGKCRHCGQPISPKYPLIETLTAVIFVSIYALLFIAQLGPATAPPRYLDIATDWPMLGLYLAVAATLLAASLIDAELYLIPLSLCYFIAIIGVVAHTLYDKPGLPGALNAQPLSAALAAGGGIGLLLSLLLLKFKILPLSFEKGEVLEVDRVFIQAEIDEAIAKGEPPPEMPVLLASGQVRIEIGKEMLFLLPPLIGAMAAATLVSAVPAFAQTWQKIVGVPQVSGFLGSILGALIGGFVVWIVRILGSLGFGRIAMGLGDVHLMLGVGAALGGGRSTVAFFIAPFFGLAFALYRWLSGQGREVPYGPYLSIASVATMFFYTPIADYLRPGLMVLRSIMAESFGR